LGIKVALTLDFVQPLFERRPGSVGRDFVDFPALLCHRARSGPPAPGNVFMSLKRSTTTKAQTAKGGLKG